MDGRPTEKIYDGRGDALADARLTVADGRMADDLRLKCTHFRLLAHVGRQNAGRGWLRVSQTELAERWGIGRTTISRAVGDLVEWGYLVKRTQEEAGESFCLYKIRLDGEEPLPAAARDVKAAGGVCAVQHTPPAGVVGGECALHSTPVCATQHTRVAPQSTPPPGAVIATRAHRQTPTNADSPPHPRKRGSREGEIETILETVKGANAARVRPVDGFLGPLVRQRRFDAPSPAYALGVLADWPLLAELADADLAALLDELKAARSFSVKQADIEAAVKARAKTLAAARKAADEAARKAAAERAALARLAPDVEPDAAPQRRDALALRRAVLETAHDGAALDDNWLGDLIVVDRVDGYLRLAVGKSFAARQLDSGYLNGVLLKAAQTLWPEVTLVGAITHAHAAQMNGRAA